MAEFESRIVGHGEEAPEQLLANPMNFRRHPGGQMTALRGSLSRLGWVKTVLVNKTTGHVIDGHARIEEAMRQGCKTIPVTYVQLTPDEEKFALASLDPISALAISDSDALASLVQDLTLTPGPTDDAAGIEAVKGMLEDLLADASSAAKPVDYSGKITAPVYTPKGERPPASDLVNQEKAKKLREAVLAAELPDDVRDFLLLAAARHNVFDYHRIAEFYCHASPEVQDLMEQSALVIIDFDKAIENGYVELSNALRGIYGDSHGDAA